MRADEVDQYLELETLRFRAALIQARIRSGISRESLCAAAGRAAGFIDEVEDLTSDPHMSSIRRYCAAVGIVYDTKVSVFVDADSSDHELADRYQREGDHQ